MIRHRNGINFAKLTASDPWSSQIFDCLADVFYLIYDHQILHYKLL